SSSSHHCDHADLHSFPTRRSSDLLQRARVLPLDPQRQRLEAAVEQVRAVAVEHPAEHPAEVADGADQPGVAAHRAGEQIVVPAEDRKSTRLNSSHVKISYAVFCLK